MYEENFRLQPWNKQWDAEKVSLGNIDMIVEQVEKIQEDVQPENKWYVCS